MLDLTNLLASSGQHLVFNAQLVHNGYSVSISALGDTGANGFVFINSDLAILLGKQLGIRTIRLPRECPVRGFDGRPAQPITHAILLTLIIDGRQQCRIPMLIANLDKHDLILGRMWFEKYAVLPDCRKRRLLWPEERSLTDEIASAMPKPVPRAILQRPKPDPVHQVDAERRDQLFEQQDRPQRQRKPPRTYMVDQQAALNKMKRAIRGEPPPLLSRRPTLPPSKPLPSIEIAMIGSAGFHRHAQKSENEVFVTSLYEIDRIIDEKKGVELEEAREIKQSLPHEYHAYLDVFSKKESDTLPPHRGPNDHRIELEGDAVPSYCPLYKQSAEELEAAKKYITENLHKGFIVPSSAPFASPILMARKPGGGLRFCVDYRKLNAITKKDVYPLPLIDEMLQRVPKAKYFTKIDIRQGFHRIRIHPDSEDLTTFKTRYGSFKYKVMPFGVTNGPATFQRYINTVLGEYLDDFTTAFVDDILIYSETYEEHVQHVKMVLQRLREAGLQASLGKCEFHTQSTRFLGFIVGVDGIKVDPEKVSVVTNWERPNTVRGIQSFLGFCNFYRRFIKNYSRVSRPLHLLTRKEVPFQWTEKCEAAFKELKQRLVTAPILAHYDPEAPTRVETDASDGVMGGVLSQQGRDLFWHPVAYFSKTMDQAQRRYDIHDREMLAVMTALREWRAELEGLQRDDRFSIFTDHQALEYFMTTKKLNARQARWSEELSRFHFLIRYRPGVRNKLADALSRKETPPDASRTQILLPRSCLEAGVHPDDTIPSESIATSLAPIHIDHVVHRVILANQQHVSLEGDRERARKGNEHWTTDQGLLLYDRRLVVPDDGDLRARLLDEIHRQPSTAHPGLDKTKALLTARYYWPGCVTDVERYVDNCQICKRTKTWRDRAPGLLHPLPIPHRPWQHISMDFREFPQDKHGYNAVFVVVDRLSKRPISIPCHKTTTARDMARLFIQHIYRWAGPPDSIVSDRGGQFISEFWGEFCRILSIKRKLSTAHHPQTDGQSEIANQYMAQRLRPYVDYYQDDWSEFLPMIDFAAAMLPQATTKHSPFLVDRGYEPRVSFDWTEQQATAPVAVHIDDARAWVSHMHDIWEAAQQEAVKTQQQQRTQANRHRREVDFDVGDEVYVTTKNWHSHRPSHKLANQASGPYKIIEKLGNSYKLQLPKSMRVYPVFSPDKLRRATRTDPLPGQLVDPPAPERINDQEEWEVERVLAARLHYRKLQYQVKWYGYDEDLNWYPASNFKNAPKQLQDFHAANPTLPGPPLRLPIWLDAALNDEFIDDHPDDGKPAPRD